jgi:hypothetical protein
LVLACLYPSAIDEILALMKMEAYEKVATYPDCYKAKGRVSGVVIGHIGNRYINVMLKLPSGEIERLWTLRGFLRSELDWGEKACEDEKEKWENPSFKCPQLLDRLSWADG